ncbi:MAG: Maf family protein [Candidatus Omnitrophica bacterium]|nr:Maf family protein [Candidatus Omnitrophota bacterium]
MNRILILASKSKRRAQILKSCGIRFKIKASNRKEKFHRQIHPQELVITNAREKARDVAKRFKKGIILGCDTLVLFKNKPIGKPKGIKQARTLLRQFRGNKLVVYTGLCLIDMWQKKEETTFAKTDLRVKWIPERELEDYLSHLGPYDKAGGFSIEGLGAVLFDNLVGSYFNVLGLPVNTLAELFKKIGLNILDFVAK